MTPDQPLDTASQSIRRGLTWGLRLGLWTATWLTASLLVVSRKWFMGAAFQESSYEITVARDFLLENGVPPLLSSLPIVFLAVVFLMVVASLAFSLVCFLIRIDRLRIASAALSWSVRSLRRPQWLTFFLV